MLIAVIRGLSHKLSLIRMMTESTRHAKYGKSSGLNRSLENLVAQLCNYERGKKKKRAIIRTCVKFQSSVMEDWLKVE